MRILIAGAGVGGLSAALSLHAAGLTQVRIAEAAPALRTLGIGLNILPNAVRELTELGVADALAAHAVATAELRLFHRCGTLIWREPRGRAAGYCWPQLAVQHGHLIGVLARAVRARLGSECLHTGVRVVDCCIRLDGQVDVALEHVACGRRETETVDVLVGADGIGSAVRARMHPDEGPPVVAPMMMWRGLSWAAPFLTGRSMVVLGTDVERIVAYPIDTSGDGTSCLVSWVAAGPVGSGESFVRAERADSAEVIERFGDWRVDWLDLPALFRAAEQIHRYPMADRNPLPQWSVGGITLLGDAAHAMLPMGSNGATQSIMDARVLAAALATGSDVAQALIGYESDRRPAMSRLQARNRGHGPEAVIAEAHRRTPEGFDHVRDVLSEHELTSVAHEYTTTAGLEVEYVNTRPPMYRSQWTEW
jgi:5-methylphenazine-1-carboxylate 1-monooxygenase